MEGLENLWEVNRACFSYDFDGHVLLNLLWSGFSFQMLAQFSASTGDTSNVCIDHMHIV